MMCSHKVQDLLDKVAMTIAQSCLISHVIRRKERKRIDHGASQEEKVCLFIWTRGWLSRATDFKLDYKGTW